jgi:hypothetical protein
MFQVFVFLLFRQENFTQRRNGARARFVRAELESLESRSHMKFIPGANRHWGGLLHSKAKVQRGAYRGSLFLCGGRDSNPAALPHQVIPIL